MKISRSNLVRIARILEWAFAVLGGVASSFVAGLFLWTATEGFTAPFGSVFPFPLLYLLEIFFVGLMGALSVFFNSGPRTSTLAALPWISAGILLAFVVLGGFSIGPGLVLPMVAFLGAGVFTDLRQGGSLLAHGGLFIVLAVVQALLMFINLIILA